MSPSTYDLAMIHARTMGQALTNALNGIGARSPVPLHGKAVRVTMRSGVTFDVIGGDLDRSSEMQTATVWVSDAMEGTSRIVLNLVEVAAVGLLWTNAVPYHSREGKAATYALDAAEMPLEHLDPASLRTRDEAIADTLLQIDFGKAPTRGPVRDLIDFLDDEGAKTQPWVETLRRIVDRDRNLPTKAETADAVGVYLQYRHRLEIFLGCYEPGFTEHEWKMRAYSIIGISFEDEERRLISEREHRGTLWDIASLEVGEPIVA